MPRRTPDQGVKPFEFRTGVGGLPKLGGMHRAGDPATVPPHKLHMGVNIRITPEGTITRPGLETTFDTGTAECIEGMIGPPSGAEPEPLVGLVVYPAGTGGFDGDFIGPGVGYRYEEYLPPKTWSSLGLVREDADTAAGEVGWAPLDLASPEDVDVVHRVFEPFIWRNKLHEFCQVTRTTPTGDQVEWALVEFVLPRNTSEAGSTKVLSYLGKQYDSEDIEYAGGRGWTERNEFGGAWADYPQTVAGRPCGVGMRADDAISGAIALREELYFLIRTTTKLFVMKFDGATVTEVTELSTFRTWGVNLMPSCRGGVWIMPNFRGEANEPTNFWHIEPDGSLTSLDWPTVFQTDLGLPDSIHGEHFYTGFVQAGGYDYFMICGMDRNFDASEQWIIRVDQSYSWSLRLLFEDINTDNSWAWGRLSGSWMAGLRGGGLAVSSRYGALQAFTPDLYDFVFRDNTSHAGFVYGVDDETVLFSSANWTQIKTILLQKNGYPEGVGGIWQYRPVGMQWMRGVDDYIVFGGFWHSNDPATNTGVDPPNGIAPGHAIYKLVGALYELDSIYSALIPAADPWYPTTSATWSLPSWGVLLTAQGDESGEITAGLLGGA